MVLEFKHLLEKYSLEVSWRQIPDKQSSESSS